MAVRTVKDAAGKDINADELYVCLEGFAGMEDRCSRGARLLGVNPLVRKYPHFFVLAATPDDVIFSLRARLWEAAGAEALVS